MEAGWKRAGRGLLGLVYPLRAVCMGCGTAAGCEEDWVCPECRQALASGWIGASPAPRGFDGAACAYAYRGPSAGIVRRMKYSGVKRLADFMAGDMLKAYRAIMPTGVDAVVPVPMHEKRLRERGYNHAALLARAVAEGLGLPCLDALSRVRETKQQARLSGDERRRNLRDSMALERPVEGRRVLLVDDVCTTGTTARECLRLLKRGGAVNVYLLCYAQAKPKSGERRRYRRV